MTRRGELGHDVVRDGAAHVFRDPRGGRRRENHRDFAFLLDQRADGLGEDLRDARGPNADFHQIFHAHGVERIGVDELGPARRRIRGDRSAATGPRRPVRGDRSVATGAEGRPLDVATV